MAGSSNDGRRTSIRMPPLNPLRAFEAAARHSSFTRAAAELHITQGAVSQSVKALEESLAHSLFDRTTSGLRLTPDGALYAAAVSESFQRITEATANFVAGRQISVVTIRAYTSFLNYWLIPRISQFQVKHPEIEVRFIAANDRIRVDPDNFDLRVRYGRGHWSGMDSTLLIQDELRPVISPKLLPADGAPYPVEALAQFTFIHSSQRRADWQDWLKCSGQSDIAPVANTTVEELSVVYRLAVSGLGVALGNRSYLDEEFAAGRLFHPVVPVLRRDAGYYLVWRAGAPITAAAKLFKEWICQVNQAGLAGGS